MTDSTAPQPSGTPLPEDHPGAVLGAYTLVEPLGEGGFGTVWTAEQQRPVRRRVALKIVKAGMGSRDVLQRFEAERQALAVMDHPGIAKVLDAGATPSGRPFFVMELVEGQRITSYADHATLTVRQRLELFVAVCHAVQHAHQKGIVHRDLKPDNVLVTEDDGRPAPRVIDFGIAKALETPLIESTLQTGAHQIMGTPAYMAPEQALRSADVDTRADVYSLGAMLYELLCGARPFEFDRRGETTLSEMLRQIQEVDPRAPSTRVLEHQGDRRRGVAAWRDTTTERLCRALRGDLDWIVQRALEKDRNRRYATVAALADDIGRHLADEPVEAGPPSRMYRISKLVRRNRGVTAGIALAGVALMGSVGVLAWSVGRVADERDAATLARELEAEARQDAELSRDAARVSAALAEQRRGEAEAALDTSRAVTGYLTGMLEAASPGDMGRDVTVRQVLDVVAPSLGTRFADRPRVEVELREAVGQTYRSLGAPDQARAHLERAVELQRELNGDDHPDTLMARQQLALLDWIDVRLDTALEDMVDVHGELLDQLGPQDRRTLEALNVLAIIRHERDEDEAALADWRQVLAGYEALGGPEDPGRLRALHNVGLVLSSMARWDEAEELLTESLELFTRIRGERHPDTMSCMNDLCVMYQGRSLWREALPLAEKLVEMRSEVLGDEHVLTLGSKVNLAAPLWHLGRNAEALVLVQQVLPVARRILGDRGDTTLMAIELLGNLHLDAERYDEAEPLIREVLAARTAIFGEDHSRTLLSQQNLGVLLRERGEFGAALEVLEDLVARRTRTLGPEHDVTLTSRYVVGSTHVAMGDPRGAFEVLEPLLDDCVRVLGPEAPGTVDVRADLAWTCLDLGRYDEAEEGLHEVYEARAELLGREHPQTVNALEGLARLYRDTGRRDELVLISRRLAAAARHRAEGPDATPWDHSQLAWYLVDGPLPELYDADEALLWAERANEATGYTVPRYLDTLSNARRATGDLQGAIEAHQAALELMSLFDSMRPYHAGRISDLQREREEQQRLQDR